jgi:Tol biopolymer transport system component
LIWSPDGKWLAYVSSRNGTEAIYRKAANGDGDEELLVKLTGSGIQLRDWSPDGRFLTYYSQQLGGNILFTVPLEGERTPVAAVRSQFPMVAAAVSPNGRFVAYRSSDSGRNLRSAVQRNGASSTTRWKVTPEGGVGPIYWRGRWEELYFVGLTDVIQTVEVNTESDFEFGAQIGLRRLRRSLRMVWGRGHIRRAAAVFIRCPRLPPSPPASTVAADFSVHEGKVVRQSATPPLL